MRNLCANLQSHGIVTSFELSFNSVLGNSIDIVVFIFIFLRLLPFAKLNFVGIFCEIIALQPVYGVAYLDTL